MLKPRQQKSTDNSEDIASDENITDDELDEILDNEDYAVTFDLPGKYYDLIPFGPKTIEIDPLLIRPPS